MKYSKLTTGPRDSPYLCPTGTHLDIYINTQTYYIYIETYIHNSQQGSVDSSYIYSPYRLYGITTLYGFVLDG